MTSNAFWQQGEIQAGRASSRPLPLEQDWAQTLLVPPDLLEVRLRLGFIIPDKHMRWQIEVTDPSTKELLALHSVPHRPLEDLEDTFAIVGARLWQIVEPLANPDPFP